MTTNQFVEYDDNGTILEGYLSINSEHASKKPVIIVAHDWSGKNNFSCGKADHFASLGYIGFALDMYGKGKLGTTKEEKSALIQPLLADRSLLLSRITAALEIVKKLPDADTSKIAAIGFCFGGLCVLDLARSGADIAGAVSIHGLLNSPEKSVNKRISAKILAMHGYDDPMVTPDKVMEFCDEMTQAEADWQFNMYGNTLHAFTNPEANDPGFGTVYSKAADARSWQAMLSFFNEIFK
jgi:dienelactone hydrolase